MIVVFFTGVIAGEGEGVATAVGVGLALGVGTGAASWLNLNESVGAEKCIPLTVSTYSSTIIWPDQV